MKTVLITFVLLLLGINSFSQIELIDSCESFSTFCGTSFRIYSDSTFFHTSGCETRQSIQIGTYTREKDTTFLHPTKIKFENFIDSIVFVPKTNASDTVDITYFEMYGKRTYSEYDRLTQVDSAIVWSNENSGHGIRKTYEAIYMHSRRSEFFTQYGKLMPKNHPYYNSSTFIIKRNVELGLILRDLFLWTGINHVVKVPKDTREIRVYYTHSSEILWPLYYYGCKLMHDTQKLETFDCHGIAHKYED